MRVETGGAELIDELEPLWLALVDHHAEVTPHLGPVHAPGPSWAMRRSDYAQWLAGEGAFVCVARDDAGRAVGYALVRITAGSPTWAEPERAAELETLSVLPEMRGAGVGGALLDAVDTRLDELGIADLRLVVMASNDAARGFYAHRGFDDWALVLNRRRPTR